MFYGSIDHSLFIILLFFITAIISYTLLKILFNRTHPIYIVAGICIISLASWSIHFLLSLDTLHMSKKTNVLFNPIAAVLSALCVTTIALTIRHLLKENKQYDKCLFFQHPDMIFLLDINGVFLSGNPAVEKNAGYKPSEYIGKHFTQLIVPDQIEKAKKIFERTLKGETYECDLQAWHKNKKIIDIHIKTVPLIRGNRLKGIYVIIQNLTELNRFRKELEHLYYKHTLILNSIAEGVCGIDQHQNIVFWNPAAERMTGYKAEEVIGKTSHAIIHHTKKDGTPYSFGECPIDRAIHDGKTYHICEKVHHQKLYLHLS